jgi:citrate lyase subunit gamma (acyl carrier protein)
MELLKMGAAGTLESGDIHVEIEKGDENGVEIDLQSTVASLYGRRIKEVICEVLKEQGITSAHVTANDKGALDCTIRARVSTALFRACEQTDCGYWK